MNVTIGVLLCMGAMILSGILGWRLYQTHSKKKAQEKILTRNRLALRKIMMNPNMIFWLRISEDGEAFESIPVTAAENTDQEPLTNLIQAATNGDIIIAEIPVQHEESYSSGVNAEWMKSRAFELHRGNHVEWITRFLPSKTVLNTLIPAAVRDQGATLFSPPPDEDHTMSVQLPEKKTPPPSSSDDKATLIDGTEPPAIHPTGTLINKGTMVLLPGTGSEVVNVPDAKPVLLPRNVRGVRNTPPNNTGGTK